MAFRSDAATGCSIKGSQSRVIRCQVESVGEFIVGGSWFILERTPRQDPTPRVSSIKVYKILLQNNLRNETCIVVGQIKQGVPRRASSSTMKWYNLFSPHRPQRLSVRNTRAALPKWRHDVMANHKTQDHSRIRLRTRLLTITVMP